MKAAKGEWLDLAEAAEYLGYGYSRASIYRKIKQGEFIKDIHYIRLSNSRLVLNVSRIIYEFEQVLAGLGSDWIDTCDVYPLLGRGHSRASLYRKIKEGAFVENIHYTRIGTRTLKFNIPKIQADWLR